MKNLGLKTVGVFIIASICFGIANLLVGNIPVWLGFTLPQEAITIGKYYFTMSIIMGYYVAIDYYKDAKYRNKEKN